MYLLYIYYDTKKVISGLDTYRLNNTKMGECVYVPHYGIFCVLLSVIMLACLIESNEVGSVRCLLRNTHSRKIYNYV